MLVFGLVSSIFDFLTFGALYFVFKLSPSGFQTGWFIESLATQVFVIFIIRTKQSIMKSIPSKPLVFSAIGVVVVGWGILMTQVGKIFGFTPLSWNIAVSIIGIVLLYLICVVFVKKWFYKKFNEL